MATKKTTVTKKNDAVLNVIDSTADELEKKAKGSGKSSNRVYVACGLMLGIKFNDVDNGNGGLKTVVFPGINSHLRGKESGILTGDGNAVLVSLDREDWECIKRKHGKERIFTAVPPLLMEVKNRDEFNERKDEIKEMATGTAPVDPKNEKVQEDKEK